MKILWRRAALDHLSNISDYIAQTNPLAARHVAQRIVGSVDRLAVFPHSGRPGALTNTREVVVPGLPYIVVYVPNDDFIDIIAVFHAAQNR